MAILGIQLFQKRLNSLIKIKSECILAPLVLLLTNSIFLYFLSFDTKTGKSKLYKAQLHNPVQKIDAIEKYFTARQVFYSNDHLFLCGFGKDILFVKLKHYSLRTFPSKKTLNAYTNFIGVSYHKHVQGNDRKTHCALRKKERRIKRKRF